MEVSVLVLYDTVDDDMVVGSGVVILSRRINIFHIKYFRVENNNV